MPSHHRGPTSLRDKVSAAWIAFSSISKALLSCLTSAKIYKQHNWPWKRIFGIHFVRYMRSLIAKPYYHHITPTTGEKILTECKEANWKLSTHLLPGEECPDAMLHEISLLDNHPKHLVLLYFHGGGYHNPPASRAHVPFAHSFAKAMNASSLFMLEYTLTPSGQYPCQLRQAALALRHLLTKLDYKPSQIVIGGDSAGGNLALALLAHIIQPHPSIRAIDEMQGKTLKAALLISPWVTMDYSSKSFEVNKRADLLDKPTMDWFTERLAPKAGEVWADMLQGTKQFWSRLPVERALLTVGTLECFQDDVMAMAKLLEMAEKNGTEVRFVLAEGEVHVQVALDTALHIRESQSTLEILKWCREMAV